MCNEDDEEFFQTIKTQLSAECAGFHEMLESHDNLGGVIIGVKVIHALIKHRVNFLIDPSMLCPFLFILNKTFVSCISISLSLFKKKKKEISLLLLIIHFM